MYVIGFVRSRAEVYVDNSEGMAESIFLAQMFLQLALLPLLGLKEGYPIASKLEH